MPSTTSLVSTSKSSDSGLRAHLHPLVLLSVSDYITRHTLQRQSQPIAGAILGQQNGREISLEFAYEVKLIQAEGGSGAWILDDAWFSERLAQYKLVHKSPALDLVGWWTTSGVEGPGREILGIHERIMAVYNESALLLAFHPSLVLSRKTADTALPLTIYETVYESRRADQSGDMVIDGEQLELKLKELPCEVVSAEAEMISVDYVARGGGNATATDPSHLKSTSTSPTKQQANGKRKGSTKESESTKIDDESGLTAEDDERKLVRTSDILRA
jgi:COP9 signalosome complex subunit 6